MIVKIGDYTVSRAQSAGLDSAIIFTEEAAAVLISELDHPALWIQLKNSGLEIAPRPGPTKGEQIFLLEVQITPRRLREAALGTDNGWLEDMDNQIAALRAQL